MPFDAKRIPAASVLTHRLRRPTSCSTRDTGFKYHDGNAQPQGFGHICFSVPHLDTAIKWFDENGVPYVKRPDQGKMKDIAFIRDPDGYWIEILESARLKNFGC
jgi:lactoylglutathione lyase